MLSESRFRRAEFRSGLRKSSIGIGDQSLRIALERFQIHAGIWRR
jgi:hypothetical protein